MKEIDDIIRIEKRIAIVLGIVLLLVSATYVFLEVFEVRNVYVEGNKHYTAAEIREMIEDGFLGDNTIYLSLKYSNKSVTDIPFVEKMDVDVVDRNTVKITVYEKTMAGFVSYLGNYIYFDKDGIVVESSTVKTDDLPFVSGLVFDHFVMYEPLPVENPEVFQIILNTTQLLSKYDIKVDKMYFDDNGKMTLYIGAIRVGIGTTDLLEEKIQRLDAILPKLLSSLEGKTGYLEMGNYDNGNEDFTFTFD